MSRVSVIIAFYEAAPVFFDEAINSVVAQTFADWELFLVDDGSTGECRRTAERYGARHPQRIHLLEHPGHANLGLSASRNLGIEASTGQYVAFLDADDVWLPNKLAEQVPLLDSHPEAAMLYGNTLYWHSWTGHPADASKDYVEELGVAPGTIIDPPELLPLFLQGKGAVPCTCSVLLRRSILECIGGLERSFRGMYEDQVLYAKVCLEYPVLVADGCWERYRQHAVSMTAISKRAGEERVTRGIYLNWLTRYMAERGIADSRIAWIIQKELWLTQHRLLSRGVRPLQRLAWRIAEHARRLRPGRAGASGVGLK